MRLEISLVQKNWRRWKWRLVSVGLLVALSFVLFLLYASSLEASTLRGVNHSSLLNLPYDLMVIIEPGERILTEQELPVTPRGSAGVPITILHYAEAATAIEVSTSKGSLSILGLKENSGYYAVDQIDLQGYLPQNDNEITLPLKLSEEMGLSIDDSLTVAAWQRHPVQTNLHTKDFKIVGIYQGFDLQPALTTISAAQSLTGSPEANRFLVNHRGGAIKQSDLIKWLRRAYPQAIFIYPQLPQDMSARLLEQIFQPGLSVLVLISVFVIIGILTIAITSFLERRKEFAAFKSIGLSNDQIRNMLIIEYALAELGGLICGFLAFTCLYPHISWLAELPFLVLLRLIILAISNTLLALIIALIFPITTAQVATVNQLLFARRIPLGSKRIDHMENPKSHFVYREREQNVRILKLLPEEEAKEIIILKEEGQIVKAGEVIATEATWLGFFTLEWISPCDGLVVERNSAGVIVIKPTDPATPFYPYPVSMIEFEQKLEVVRLRGAEEAKGLLWETDSLQGGSQVTLAVEKRRERIARQTKGEYQEIERTYEKDYAAQARREQLGMPQAKSFGSLRRKHILVFATLTAIAFYALGWQYAIYLRTLGQVTTYEVSLVQLDTLRDTVTADITLNHPLNSSVISKKSGLITEIFANKGELVYQGQPLIRLTDAQTELALLQAQHDALQAHLTYDSLTLLPINIDTTREEVELLRLKVILDSHQQRNQSLTLLAPAEGRVTNLPIREGQDIMQGDLIISFYDDSPAGATAKEIEILQAHEVYLKAKQNLEARQIRAPFSGWIRKVDCLEYQEYELGSSLLVIEPQGFPASINELAYRQAQISFTDTQKAIASLTIRAPATGWLLDFQGEVGELLKSSSSVANLASARELKVNLLITEQQALNITHGSLVEAIVAHTGQKLEGYVQNLRPNDISLKSDGKVYLIAEITLDNKHHLQAGLQVIINISNQSSTVITNDLKGILEYPQLIPLSTIAGGMIKQILIQPHTWVEEGDIIAILENEELNLSLAQAREEAQKKLQQIIHSPIKASIQEIFINEGAWVETNQILIQLNDELEQAIYVQAEQDLRTLINKEVANTWLLAPLDAQLETLYVQEGEWVKAGQVLAKLIAPTSLYEEKLAELAVEKQEAIVQSIKDNPLAEILGKTDLQRRQADLQVTKLSNALNQLIIKAPLTGIWHPSTKLEIGSSITPSQALGSIVETLPSYTMEIAVEEHYLNLITKGLPVRILVSAFPKDIYEGWVNAIYDEAIITDTAVSYPIAFTFIGESKLKPGMSARVEIVLRQAENALIVSNHFLREQESEDGLQLVVDRVIDGKIVITPVQLGLITKTHSQVLTGVREGEILAATKPKEATLNDLENYVANMLE